MTIKKILLYFTRNFYYYFKKFYPNHKNLLNFNKTWLFIKILKIKFYFLLFVFFTYIKTLTLASFWDNILTKLCLSCQIVLILVLT